MRHSKIYQLKRLTKNVFKKHLKQLLSCWILTACQLPRVTLGITQENTSDTEVFWGGCHNLKLSVLEGISIQVVLLQTDHARQWKWGHEYNLYVSISLVPQKITNPQPLLPPNISLTDFFFSRADIQIVFTF